MGTPKPTYVYHINTSSSLFGGLSTVRVWVVHGYNVDGYRWVWVSRPYEPEPNES